MNSPLSEYELQRDENIRRNEEKLASLGLLKCKPPPPPPPPPPKPNPPRKSRPNSQPTRTQQSRGAKRALEKDAYTKSGVDLRTLPQAPLTSTQQPQSDSEEEEEWEGEESEAEPEPEPEPEPELRPKKRQRQAEKDLPYPIATDYVKVPPREDRGPKLSALQTNQLLALVNKHLKAHQHTCSGAGPRTASNIRKTIRKICELAFLGEFPDIDMKDAIEKLRGSEFSLKGFTPIWTALEGHGKRLPTLQIGEEFLVMNKHLCNYGWTEDGVQVEQHSKFASGLRYLYFFLEQFNKPLRDNNNGAGFAKLLQDPVFLNALASAELE